MRFATFLLALMPLLGAHPPVRVSGGQISGTPGKNPEIRVYKGIPFAAPPVGELRWRPPAPAVPWQGIRDATRFSPICSQQPYPEGSIYRSAPQPSSEDCLYLNVWTGARSGGERRPVMVWIHGGALTRGSGSTPTYDGEELAAKGVVLVTVNYRLGVLGFLAHPELTRESSHHSSGNYGFLDQVAALEWVRKNIAAFGGDPGRVTIFGESAGSWSVNLLVATPLAKGLFASAIGESGANFGPMQKLAQAEQTGLRLSGAIAELRAKSAEELLKASAGLGFPANVDGWVLPSDVHTIFANGQQNDVPLIAGSNADEGTALSPWPAEGSAAAFTAQMRQRFGNLAGRFFELYPAATGAEAKAAHYASYRDFVFGWQMRTWARMAVSNGKSKAYLYYFSRVPPGPNSGVLGAYHAGEISYVFHNLHLSTRPYEDADRKLSGLMSSYWVNFAATGDPNGKDLPKWPAYGVDSDLALEFGDSVAPRQGLHRQALDFFDDYFRLLEEKAGKPN